MGELQTTTGNQPLTLAEKISAANDKLRPASDDAIASAIIKLAGAGLAFPAGIEPSGAARVYQFALRGVSLEALKRSVMRIVQGEIESVRNFIPTPPALASIVKAEARELWADRERLMLTAESIKLSGGREPASEESKARIRELNRQVQERARELREAEKFALYDKPEDELNRIFKNKVDPPEAQPPAAGKWSDEAWFQQQKEMENGEETERVQGAYRGDDPGNADGRGDNPEVSGSVFGFEDGGE